MKKKHVFIIAEAGVNHNGSVDLARELIDAAVNVKADAIKFQTFTADALVRRETPAADYQKKMVHTRASQYDLLKALELNEDAHKTIVECCAKRNIQFLSTAFDIRSLDMLVNTFGMSLIKIPSGEITNGPFLLKAGQTGKPIILSTGMSTVREIKVALSVIAFGYTVRGVVPSERSFREAFVSKTGQAALRRKVTLLHCTSEYPAPPDEINLKAITTLSDIFGLPAGFSDHSAGIYAPMAAVALGATVIEKHFTLDRRLPGPDHMTSLEPGELREMVQGIREIERFLGNGKKVPTVSELKNRDLVRKSIVAREVIKKDDRLSPGNVTFKRPANGLSPMSYWRMLGKLAGKDYKADESIMGTGRK